MMQLSINETEYPKTSHDKYKCYQKDIGESLRTISGRLITEVRAKITIIEYSYDHFADALTKKCLTDLRSGKDLTVRYLDPETGNIETELFRCTKWPAPTFAFSNKDKARWHNINFTLEAVEGK